MILYDESYNFLGMSEKILNRLGYDDLDEFCTYHKDFAELFEKENGLIYNFENFSWIDFVLYGGANKDRAIIKTKNGTKLDVQLQIQEIKIKDESLGISKLFSVELIQKGIIQENSQTLPETKNHINLSSMLDEDIKEENLLTAKKDQDIDNIFKNNTQEDLFSKETKNNNLDINLSFIKKDEIKEDTKTTTPSFSLDFLNKNKNEEENEIKPKKQEDDDSKVVLNFFNSTIDNKDNQNNSLEIKKEPIEDSKKNSLNNEILSTPNQTQTKINLLQEEEIKKDLTQKTSNSNIDLNFLKKEKNNNLEISNISKEDNQTKEQTINLNLLKDTQESIDNTPSINLNFLKTNIDEEDDNNLITSKQKFEENKTPNIDLNFLKLDEDHDLKTKNNPSIKSENDSLENLNFLKNQEEFEETKENTQKDLYQEEKDQNNRSTTIDLNFLTSPKQEEPINEIKTTQIQEELSPEKKSKIIKQIKTDINEIDKTNKNTDHRINQQENNPKEDEIVINDALKSILHIEKKEEVKKQKSSPKIKITQIKQENTKRDFDFLPNLNISRAQKIDILNDFINDANYNIKLIEKYLNLNDIDSVKYLAIKIKSSAEILKLTDISTNIQDLISKENDINSIKNSINKIIQLINILKEYTKSE